MVDFNEIVRLEKERQSKKMTADERNQIQLLRNRLHLIREALAKVEKVVQASYDILVLLDDELADRMYPAGIQFKEPFDDHSR